MGKVKDRKRRAKAASLKQSRQAKEGGTRPLSDRHMQERIAELEAASVAEVARTVILARALEEIVEVTAKSRSKDAKAAHEIAMKAAVAYEQT